jgi:hypothetical protein
MIGFHHGHTNALNIRQIEILSNIDADCSRFNVNNSLQSNLPQSTVSIYDGT